MFSLISKIISVNQNAFMKGRGIFANVILAQEVIHDINYKVVGHNLV